MSSSPMALGIWLYMAIAPNYILCKIQLKAKRYGIKNSITNLMNQLSCTLDVTIVLG